MGVAYVLWVGKLCFNKHFGNCISRRTWPKIHMQKKDYYLNFQGTHGTYGQKSVTKVDVIQLGLVLEWQETFD